MADRVETRQVTVPPGTSQANAVQTDISFPQGRVQEIELVIPDGHAGVTGIALAIAHQIVIPYSGNSWIVSNDEILRFGFADRLGNGNWQTFTYNNDFANSHTFYIRFFINELVTQQVAQPVALPVSDIAASGAASAAGAQIQPVETPPELGLISSFGSTPSDMMVPVGGTSDLAALLAAGAQAKLAAGETQLSSAEAAGLVVTEGGTQTVTSAPGS